MDMCGHCVPVEIIERILHFLPAKDVVICSNVCSVWKQIIESDNFWKKKCWDIGYNLRDKMLFMRETGLDSWRELFWCDYNRRNNLYVSKLITSEKRWAMNQMSLCGTMMIFVNDTEIEVWDIEGDPQVKQRLKFLSSRLGPNDSLHVNINYIAYERDSKLHIYSNHLNEFKLEKIVFLGTERTVINSDNSSMLLFEEYTDINDALDSSSQDGLYCEMSLNDDKLAVLVYKKTSMYLWSDKVYVFCLASWNSYKIDIPHSCDIFQMKLIWPRVYIFKGNFDNAEFSVTILVFNVFSNSCIMEIQQPSIIGFDYSIDEEFIVGTNLLELSFGEVRVLFNFWRSVDGTLIYGVNEDNQGTNNQGKIFIIDKSVLLKANDKIILVDPILGVKLRQFTIPGYEAISVLNKNYLLACTHNVIDVWDTNKGIKLYTLGNDHCGYPRMTYSSNNNLLYSFALLSRYDFIPVCCIFDFREIKSV